MNITKFSSANGKDPISTLGLTNDQRKAYEGLIQFIDASYNANDYKRALVGAAGTGKTYLLKAVIKNCNTSYSLIGLAAPTHKACRVLHESIRLPNIKVNTLQSDLGLKLNFDVDKFDINNPPFDPKGRIKIGNYKIYIIDESSMINRGLVLFLEKYCKKNECKTIYVGDDSQLSPVNEKYSSAFKGLITFKLKEIIRQGEDNPVSYLLDLLRYDVEHKTYKFLNYISKNPTKFNTSYTKGYEVCNSEMFNKLVYTNFNDEELSKNVDFAKVIGYTNVCVSSWNKFIRNAIIKDCDKSIITKNDLIISYTTIVNKFNEPVIKNSEEYIIHDIVNYVHPQYNLKGFMIKFQAIHGGQISQPLFVVDHSDLFSIKLYVKLSQELVDSARSARAAFRAPKWKEYYTFKESCLLLTNIISPDGRTILYSRDLDYGFALTSHKSQGSTFDTAFVDIDDIVFDKNGVVYTDCEEVNRRLYVACSRCRNKLYLKFNRLWQK